MARLIARRRYAALAALAMIASFALAQSPDTPVTVEDKVRAGEEAYLAADLDAALELGQAAVSALPSVIEVDAELALAARSHALVIQSLFNLGRTDGLEEAFDALLRVDPSYALSPDLAGVRLSEMLEKRRAATYGWLRVACAPLPCETIVVDGRTWTPDAEGRVPVLAGERSLRAVRHGFVVDEGERAVEVAAGETAEIEIAMRQVARDVVARTSPSGVTVELDGEPVGRSEPTVAGGEPRFEIRSVEPGLHVLVFESPCHSRLEQKIDVVLDELEPGPLDLGRVELAPASSSIEIVWNAPEGTLAIDGDPVTPGVTSVCPGTREVSVSLGGRRVWFDSFELRDGESIRVEPTPRPTLAVVRGGEGEDSARLESLRRGLVDEWNLVEVSRGGEAAVELVRKLDLVPIHPERTRIFALGAVQQLSAVAPEADVLVLWPRQDDPVRPRDGLMLVDPVLGLVEATAWVAGSESDDSLARIARGLLEARTAPTTLYVGLDVVDRRDGPPVVALVDRGGPAAAAGIAAGNTLVSLAGEPVVEARAFAETLRESSTGSSWTVEIGTEEGAREATLSVAENLSVLPPAEWGEGFVVPSLARARLDAVVGRGKARVAGQIAHGMILASLGRSEEAAGQLDRVSIDPLDDPSGDARGTVLLVLARLLETLERDGYASEVRARLAGLESARFGGRDGVPIVFATPRSE